MALYNAVNDIFAFQSAESAAMGAEPAAQLGERLTTLEDAMAKIGSGFKVMMERETCAAAARPSRGPTADDREAKRPRPGREEAWRSPGAAEGKRVSQLGSGRGQGRAGCWCQQRWTD